MLPPCGGVGPLAVRRQWNCSGDLSGPSAAAGPPAVRSSGPAGGLRVGVRWLSKRRCPPPASGQSPAEDRKSALAHVELLLASPGSASGLAQRRSPDRCDGLPTMDWCRARCSSPCCRMLEQTSKPCSQGRLWSRCAELHPVAAFLSWRIRWRLANWTCATWTVWPSRWIVYPDPPQRGWPGSRGPPQCTLNAHGGKQFLR
mmetsp:Transcript_30365/g.86939  ORF Transcript_30365/g.86939 Transcript_30365/m.86939 type:complete len:201 (-) Transcript_30365:434-1036(-)